MSHIEKEKLIKADIASIEKRVRHAFNQGYDLGFKDGIKGSIPKADYENRLKADMVAMLEEIKEQLREMHEDFFETEHFDEAYGVSDSMDVIQQKINDLGK